MECAREVFRIGASIETICEVGTTEYEGWQIPGELNANLKESPRKHATDHPVRDVDDFVDPQLANYPQ